MTRLLSVKSLFVLENCACRRPQIISDYRLKQGIKNKEFSGVNVCFEGLRWNFGLGLIFFLTFYQKLSKVSIYA